MQEKALPFSESDKPHCVIVTEDKYAVKELIQAMATVKVTTRAKESCGKHILVTDHIDDLDLVQSQIVVIDLQKVPQREFPASQRLIVVANEFPKSRLPFSPEFILVQTAKQHACKLHFKYVSPQDH